MGEKNKEVYMYVLGAIIIVITFLILGILVFVEIPEKNSDIFYMAIGQMITGTLAVVFYFYGSSKSSSDKTNIIANKKNNQDVKSQSTIK